MQEKIESNESTTLTDSIKDTWNTPRTNGELQSFRARREEALGAFALLDLDI